MAPINPMQRKARNSFILGMVIMFIISAIIIVFLLIMFQRTKTTQGDDPLVRIFVLNKDVKSGEIINIKSLQDIENMLQEIEVKKSLIPENALSIDGITQLSLKKNNFRFKSRKKSFIYSN